MVRIEGLFPGNNPLDIVREMEAELLRELSIVRKTREEIIAAMEGNTESKETRAEDDPAERTIGERIAGVMDKDAVTHVEGFEDVCESLREIAKKADKETAAALRQGVKKIESAVAKIESVRGDLECYTAC